MDRESIKEQFGANAASYAVSKVHAKGASLARLVEMVETQPDWLVLDIATAAGHTAFAFAPHVAQVWATDITPEMLDLAQQQAQERGLKNVAVEYADAEDLPYEAGKFDLVTCRIAPHHFMNVHPFMRESARVLKPGGILAIVDNVVPEGAAGDYVNAFEKFRDPSHGRCLSMNEWHKAYSQVGLSLLHEETLDKAMPFEFWAKRHEALTVRFLRAMLSEVGGEAAAFLRPQFEAGKTTFYLREGLFIGQKPTN